MAFLEACAFGLMRVCRLMPIGVAQWFGTSLGRVWYRCVPVRQAETKTRIQDALNLDAEEADTLLCAMHCHLSLSMVELLRFGGPRGLPLDVDYRGQENLDIALSKGRGVLLLTGHVGNWELLVRFGANLPRPCSVVSKTMTSEWAQRIWSVLRIGAAGIVHTQGSARRILNALRNNEIIGFALDQHAPELTALRVPFFGKDAWTTTALVRYALAGDTPIVPMFTFRNTEGKHVIHVLPELEFDRSGRRLDVLARGTDACNRCLETQIRTYPAQWLWLHRRWKKRADPRILSG